MLCSVTLYHVIVYCSEKLHASVYKYLSCRQNYYMEYAEFQYRKDVSCQQIELKTIARSPDTSWSLPCSLYSVNYVF